MTFVFDADCVPALWEDYERIAREVSALRVANPGFSVPKTIVEEIPELKMAIATKTPVSKAYVMNVIINALRYERDMYVQGQRHALATGTGDTVDQICARFGFGKGVVPKQFALHRLNIASMCPWLSMMTLWFVKKGNNVVDAARKAYAWVVTHVDKIIESDRLMKRIGQRLSGVVDLSICDALLAREIPIALESIDGTVKRTDFQHVRHPGAPGDANHDGSLAAYIEMPKSLVGLDEGKAFYILNQQYSGHFNLVLITKSYGEDPVFTVADTLAGECKQYTWAEWRRAFGNDHFGKAFEFRH